MLPIGYSFRRTAIPLYPHGTPANSVSYYCTPVSSLIGTQVIMDPIGILNGRVEQALHAGDQSRPYRI